MNNLRKRLRKDGLVGVNVMPPLFRSLYVFIVCVVFVALAGCQQRDVRATDWHHITWADSPAWEADSNGIRAIVSERYGRLVWFGPIDGPNLLFVPPGGSVIVGGAALHGGHQCWLGPQDRWHWPPPQSWESAAQVTIRGPDLILDLPSSDRFPTITRRYRFTDGALLCGVRWSPSPSTGWFPMQVFQVPRDMRIAQLHLTPGIGLSATSHLPAEWVITGDMLNPEATPNAARADVAAQTLRGTLNGWELVVAPASDAPTGAVGTVLCVSTPAGGYQELEQFGAVQNSGGAESMTTLTVRWNQLSADPLAR